MNKKIPALALAFAMTASLAACGGGTSASPAPEGSAPVSSAAPSNSVAAGDLKVGVFYYNYGDTYIASVRTALDAALDAKGINYTDYDGNNTPGTQMDQINTALTDGANLLIVDMVTSGAPTPPTRSSSWPATCPSSSSTALWTARRSPTWS